MAENLGGIPEDVTALMNAIKGALGGKKEQTYKVNIETKGAKELKEAAKSVETFGAAVKTLDSSGAERVTKSVETIMGLLSGKLRNAPVSSITTSLIDVFTKPDASAKELLDTVLQVQSELENVQRLSKKIDVSLLTSSQMNSLLSRQSKIDEIRYEFSSDKKSRKSELRREAYQKYEDIDVYKMARGSKNGKKQTAKEIAANIGINPDDVTSADAEQLQTYIRTLDLLKQLIDARKEYGEIHSSADANNYLKQEQQISKVYQEVLKQESAIRDKFKVKGDPLSAAFELDEQTVKANAQQAAEAYVNWFMRTLQTQLNAALSDLDTRVAQLQGNIEKRTEQSAQRVEKNTKFARGRGNGKAGGGSGSGTGGTGEGTGDGTGGTGSGGGEIGSGVQRAGQAVKQLSEGLRKYIVSEDEAIDKIHDLLEAVIELDEEMKKDNIDSDEYDKKFNEQEEKYEEILRYRANLIRQGYDSDKYDEEFGIGAWADLDKNTKDIIGGKLRREINDISTYVDSNPITVKVDTKEADEKTQAVKDKVIDLSKDIGERTKIRIFDGVSEEVFDVEKDLDALIAKLDQMALKMEKPVFHAGDLEKDSLSSDSYRPADSLQFVVERHRGDSMGTGTYFASNLGDIIEALHTKSSEGKSGGIYAADLGKYGSSLLQFSGDEEQEAFGEFLRKVTAFVMSIASEDEAFKKQLGSIKVGDTQALFNELKTWFDMFHVNIEDLQAFIDEQVAYVKGFSSTSEMSQSKSIGTNFQQKFIRNKGIDITRGVLNDSYALGNLIFDIDKEHPFDIAFGNNEDIAAYFYKKVFERILSRKAANPLNYVDDIVDQYIGNSGIPSIEEMGTELTPKLQVIGKAHANDKPESISTLNASLLQRDSTVGIDTSEAQKQIEALKQQVSELQQQLQELSTVDKPVVDVDELQAKLERAQEEIDELNHALAGTVSESSNNFLSEQLSEAEQRIHELSEEIASLKQQLTDTQQKVQQAPLDMGVLDKKVAELQYLHDKVRTIFDAKDGIINEDMSYSDKFNSSEVQRMIELLSQLSDAELKAAGVMPDDEGSYDSFRQQLQERITLIKEAQDEIQKVIDGQSNEDRNELDLNIARQLEEIYGMAEEVGAKFESRLTPAVREFLSLIEGHVGAEEMSNFLGQQNIDRYVDDIISGTKTAKEAFADLENSFGWDTERFESLIDSEVPEELKGLYDQLFSDVENRIKSAEQAADEFNAKLKEISEQSRSNQSPILSAESTAENEIGATIDLFQKLIDIINNSGETFKQFFRNLKSGSLEINDDVTKLLNDLGIMEGENLNASLAKYGSRNKGVLVSDKYTMLARDSEYLPKAQDLQPKLAAAKEAGANVADIIGIIEDKANGLIYEIQSTVFGKNVGFFDVDYLEASDEQIQKLIEDIRILEKSGLFVDVGSSNILYDKEKGFSFVDLATRKAPYTSNNPEEIIDRMLQMAGHSGKNVDNFRRRVSSFINQQNGFNNAYIEPLDDAEVTLEKISQIIDEIYSKKIFDFSDKSTENLNHIAQKLREIFGFLNEESSLDAALIFTSNDESEVKPQMPHVLYNQAFLPYQQRLDELLSEYKDSYYSFQSGTGGLEQLSTIRSIAGEIENDYPSYIHRLEEIRNEIDEKLRIEKPEMDYSSLSLDSVIDLDQLSSYINQLDIAKASQQELFDIISKANELGGFTSLPSEQVDLLTEKMRELGYELDEVTQKWTKIQSEDIISGNLHLITDEFGRIVTFYRGLRSSMGQGLVSDRFNGASFWTDSLDLAKEYSQWSKVESANLAMINPLEIAGNGANWNDIEYLGTGMDEASKKITAAKNTIIEAMNQVGYYVDKLNITKDSEIGKFRDYVSEIFADGGYPEEVIDRLRNSLQVVEEAWAEYQKISADMSNVYGRHNTKEFVAMAQESGLYDGVIFKDIVDTASGIVSEATNVVVQFKKENIKFIETISAPDNLNKRDISAITDNYSQVISILSEEESKFGQFESKFKRGFITPEAYQEEEDYIQRLRGYVDYFEEILPQLKDYKEQIFGIMTQDYDASSITVPMEKYKDAIDQIRSELIKTYQEIQSISRRDIADRFGLWGKDAEDLMYTLNGELNEDDFSRIADEIYHKSVEDLLKRDEFQARKKAQVKELADNFIFDQYNLARSSAVDNNTNVVPDVSVEASGFTTLEQSVQSVAKAVDEKTMAFSREAQIVQESVQIELASLQQLVQQLEAIRDLSQNLPKIQLTGKDGTKVNPIISPELIQSIEQLKTAIGDFDPQKLTALFASIKNLKINENVSTRMTELATGFGDLREALDGWEGNAARTLEMITQLVQKANALKDVIKTANEQNVKQPKVEKAPAKKEPEKPAQKSQDEIRADQLKAYNAALKEFQALENARVRTGQSVDKLGAETLSRRVQLTSQLDSIQKAWNDDAAKGVAKTKEMLAAEQQRLVNAEEIEAAESKRWNEQVKKSINFSNLQSRTTKLKAEKDLRPDAFGLRYEEIEKKAKELSLLFPLKPFDEDAAQNARDMAEELDKMITETRNAPEYKLAKDNFVSGLGRKMETWAANNGRAVAANKGAWEKIQEEFKQIDTLADGQNVSKMFDEFVAGANRAGQAGETFTQGLMKRFKSLGQYLLSFASFYRVIGVFKQVYGTVKELDDALVEMRKVSDESLSSLQRYQSLSFNMADEVGTTAQQIQQSTADWLRLGESFEEAQKSAKESTILLNVSEFENIDKATEALVSASQAYKDLDKIDIIDKLNNIGNNFSISTDQLATGLQNAAAVLMTQGNDIDEALALLTAGNALPGNTVMYLLECI